MKYLLFAFIIAQNVCSAQEGPHFEVVMNVYRRDKSALDEYAKEFIHNNPELFCYKGAAYVDNHQLKMTPKPFEQSDSGVISNAIYVYKEDTIYCKIGFLSKNNRTKLVLLDSKNYYKDYYLKDFLDQRFQSIMVKYKSLLRLKNNDNKNW